MQQVIKLRTRAIGVFLAAAACAAPVAAQQVTNVSSGTILEPAIWQGPEINSQSTGNRATVISGSATPSADNSMHSVANPLRIALQPTPPIPPQGVQYTPQQLGAQNFQQPQPLVPPTNPTVSAPTQPLLDGNSPTEDLMPSVVDGEGCGDLGRGVRPYGGGHPGDWSWGCGGSPYRTGPGLCDNWKVGPRWHFTFDGLVMSRDETNLGALQAQMMANDLRGTVGPVNNPLTPDTEQFDRGPGGRITITSQVPKYVGYQIQMAYEGIIDWDASVIFPKTMGFLNVASPPAAPVVFADALQQRSLKYTSDYNSGEISWVRSCDDDWHPFCGVRFIQVGDRIQDFFDQQAPPPLPVVQGGVLPVGPVTTTDRINVFDIDNNLMGFQVGMLRETWCITRRCSIEGFANAGVYYNKVNYFNRMATNTTQVFADNLSTLAVDESRVDFSNNELEDQRDYNNIAYVTEASITGVCRLNKCWSLRSGYQVLWIDNVRLADAAFLGNANQSDSLFFHGWHAGIECRR